MGSPVYSSNAVVLTTLPALASHILGREHSTTPTAASKKNRAVKGLATKYIPAFMYGTGLPCTFFLDIKKPKSGFVAVAMMSGAAAATTARAQLERRVFHQIERPQHNKAL